MEYASPWVGFKLTTLVVIGFNCIGSCKSNYHTITTMAPHSSLKQILTEKCKTGYKKRVKYPWEGTSIEITIKMGTIAPAKHDSTY